MKKGYKGSMLVGVLIIMLMIAAISLAVIYRTTQGVSIVTSSNKGFSVYQGSDESAEEVLDKIKNIDKEVGRIPENVSYSDACGSFDCFDGDGEKLTGNKKVSDVYVVEGVANSQSTTRSVSAPVPDRVTNPISGLSVENGTVAGGHPNRCDALLSWTIGIPADSSNIEKLEIRYTFDGSALSSGSWNQPDPHDIIYSSSKLSQWIKNENFEYYNKSYYFAMKAKNKNNFSLDSLYSPKNNGVEFSVSEKDCSGGKRLECKTVGILGSKVSSSAYTCCGGTECYECESGWRKDNKDCCTEECPTTPMVCDCGGLCGNAVYTGCIENSCNSRTPEKCDTSGCYTCP